MKKTLIALFAMGTVASAATTVLVEQDFTTLDGYSHSWDNNGTAEDPNDDKYYEEEKVVLPQGWYTGQWNGNDTPHYVFGDNGAVVHHNWKQNYLWTAIELSSQADATITFTLYNNQEKEDTGNMFYLSSSTYSIVIGNSYSSNSDIYVGTLDEAIGSGFVSFQTGTGKNPTVKDNSTGLNINGDITYTLTLKGGDLKIKAESENFDEPWETKLSGMNDVTFTSLGFINDGGKGTAGVKKVSLSIPEPTTATLSLLALAGLAARRRRK